MKPEKKAEWGKKAREWTIKNFSTESIGKILEEEFDSMEFINYDSFSIEEEQKNPEAKIEDIEDTSKWLVSLYKEILKMEVDATDSGHKYWSEEMKKGMSRAEVEKYFRSVASQENQKNKKVEFSEVLDKDDEGKRILYVMPESIGDIYLSTSLFKSAKELYPDHNLYVAVKPEYFDILDGNPYIHKVIPYVQQMDHIVWLEGQGSHQGFFEIAFLPYGVTQKFLTYLHNGKDKIAYKDYKYEQCT